MAVWAQQCEVLWFVVSPIAVFVLDLNKDSAGDGMALGPSAAHACLDS
jgi:hypothetical protein